MARDMLCTVQHPGLSRISADFHVTTGRHLELDVDPPPDERASFIVTLRIDDGYVGHELVEPSADPETFVAEAADRLREYWLDEEVWGGWPTCPRHGGHPLDPALDSDGAATWFCPQSGPVARIGSLDAAVSLKREPR